MHWLIWLSAGIILAILEVFTPGFFIVGIGVSLAIAALPAALGLPFWVQLLVCGAMILIFFLLVRPLVMKIPHSDSKKTGTAALIGEEGIVVETITRIEGGRVKVGGEVWKAKSDETIEKDLLVVVTGVEGVTLNVRRK
ncbi:MAG: NfeD family protein [Spirochaetales bacterium]|nr:NfeD family protein [Spirochaetales bacterium]